MSSKSATFRNNTITIVFRFFLNIARNTAPILHMSGPLVLAAPLIPPLLLHPPRLRWPRGTWPAATCVAAIRGRLTRGMGGKGSWAWDGFWFGKGHVWISLDQTNFGVQAS